MFYNLHSSAARPASLSAAAAANATVATAAATASAGAGVFVTRLMDLDLGSPAYVVAFVEISNDSKMATDLICRATRNSTITLSSVRITRLFFETSTLGCKNRKNCWTLPVWRYAAGTAVDRPLALPLD